jgi:4-alpha-glucanotransferase
LQFFCAPNIRLRMLLNPQKKIAGLLAPLFALRSEQDLGVGDIGALRDFVDWAADSGIRLVQLLPINESGSDNSPYNAISSVAIEPTTLELNPKSLPDLDEKGYRKILEKHDLNELRAGAVKYSEVKQLKHALLHRAFENFSAHHWRRNTKRARAFREFIKTGEAWLNGYALFRLLMKLNTVGEVWDQWPEEHRTNESASAWLSSQKVKIRRDLENRMRYFMYVQWIAFQQWREMHSYCAAKNVALMGDVPFGVSYYSADVFTRPDLFNLEWSGGAPPEPYFKDDEFTQKWGQNWGVPIYRWDVMEREGYAWWRQRVRMVREIFHLFRIDHVLGFYRIYAFPWRPVENADYLQLTETEAREKAGGELPHFVDHADDNWEHCEANRAAGEKRLRVLLEEVGEFRLIGEDLGTVPDYVRPNLTSLGIAGFKIPMWERKDDTWLIDGPQYQRLSVVSYATHDHEPLRALWDRLYRTGSDASDPAAAGEAREEQRKIAGFAARAIEPPLPWSEDLHVAFLASLFRSNSWMAICMITDLFGTSDRFNVPGAIAESNWSRRTTLPVSLWPSDPAIESIRRKVQQMLVETERS